MMDHGASKLRPFAVVVADFDRALLVGVAVHWGSVWGATLIQGDFRGIWVTTLWSVVGRMCPALAECPSAS
jgi:hypothetical protein